MQRSAQKCHMAADWFAAGKSADGLVDHRLKNRSRQILLGSAFVDQRLDICLGKHAAARRDRIERLIIFGVFVQARCIGLYQGSHLVDKRTCTAGTDPVHALLHIAALEVDDLGIFPAKLDCDICLGGKLLQGGGHSDNLLHKRYA